MMEKIENIIISRLSEEAEEIINGARKGADEILLKSEKEAHEIIELYLKNAQDYINSQRQREIGKVQLELNSKIIDIEHQIINRIFQNIEDEIITILQDSSEYKNYFKTLIEEVFQNNKFQRPVVYVNPKDVEIVKSFLKDVEIKSSEEVLYGIVVQDEERGFIVRNTLKTRIDKVKQIILEKARSYWV